VTPLYLPSDELDAWRFAVPNTGGVMATVFYYAARPGQRTVLARLSVRPFVRLSVCMT